MEKRAQIIKEISTNILDAIYPQLDDVAAKLNNEMEKYYLLADLNNRLAIILSMKMGVK